MGSELKRRNSAGSVDFSFGNSFSGKHSFMFSETLRMLNLKPGQFVTCLVVSTSTGRVCGLGFMLSKALRMLNLKPGQFVTCLVVSALKGRCVGYK